jgi:hypothetical protein
MLSEEDKAEFRRISRAMYAELRDVPDELFQYRDQLPLLPDGFGYPWYWDFVRGAYDCVIGIARSTAGRIVMVCWFALSAASNVQYLREHILIAPERVVQQIDEAVDSFVKNGFAKFDPTKDRSLAVYHDRKGDLAQLIPEQSGILPPEIFDSGLPPVPIHQIINNSMQVSNRTVLEYHLRNEPRRRRINTSNYNVLPPGRNPPQLG